MVDSRMSRGQARRTWGLRIFSNIALGAMALTLALMVGVLAGPHIAAAAPGASQQSQPEHRTYVVRNGDSLGAIALRFDITQDALMRANNIRNPNVVYVGQVLIIPGAHTATTGPQAGHASNPGTSPATYVVKRGDTLGDIAKRFNTTIQALMQENRISNPNRIEVGDVLRIPGQGGKDPVYPVQPPAQPPVQKPVKPEQPSHPVQPPTAHPGKEPVKEPTREPVKPPVNRPDEQPRRPDAPDYKPPAHKPDAPVRPTDYWVGSYYSGKYFDQLVEERHDPEIRFNWYADSPLAGLPEDRFSVRWERTEHFREGWYRFHAIADDGVRVYIDGTLIIDGWHIQPATEYKAEVHISGGLRQVSVEYFEEANDAQIHVYYEALKGQPPVIKR